MEIMDLISFISLFPFFLLIILQKNLLQNRKAALEAKLFQTSDLTVTLTPFWLFDSVHLLVTILIFFINPTNIKL